jgi:4-amino-4-deoxy-L-arabinose transferase-like glycosyltransferase
MHAPLTSTAATDDPSIAAKRSDRLLLIGLVVLACLLRVPFMDRSIWFDEACMSSQRIGTWPQLLATVYVDIHPPLYIVCMHLWNGMFGDSEIAMRVPPLLSGLAAIPAAFWTGRRLVGSTAALWAAALMALSPVHVWYSVEARLYAPMLLCTVVAFGTYDRLLDASSERTRSLWCLHVVNLAVMLALHYYLAVYVVVLAVAAPSLRGFTRRARQLMIWHGVGLVALAGFVAAKRAIGEFETEQGYLRAMTPGEAYDFLFDWCWTGHTLVAAGNPIADAAHYVYQATGIALVVLGARAIWTRRREMPNGVLVPLGLLTIPLFLMGLAIVGY